jgi:hypothetical protein
MGYGLFVHGGPTRGSRPELNERNPKSEEKEKCLCHFATVLGSKIFFVGIPEPSGGTLGAGWGMVELDWYALFELTLHDTLAPNQKIQKRVSAVEG